MHCFLCFNFYMRYIRSTVCVFDLREWGALRTTLYLKNWMYLFGFCQVFVRKWFEIYVKQPNYQKYKGYLISSTKMLKYAVLANARVHGYAQDTDGLGEMKVSYCPTQDISSLLQTGRGIKITWLGMSTSKVTDCRWKRACLQFHSILLSVTM